FLAGRRFKINKASADLVIEKTTEPNTSVVDFSSPNIAKQMHVGHLRSTIIGDSICRTLEALGHKVIRQNHVGDWGTALGKVILGLWHMCMAEKRGGKAYYEIDLEELKGHADSKQELKDICDRIRKRDEEDWEEDCENRNSRGDGKKRFRPFLKNLQSREKGEMWERITILYQYVNLLEESSVGMGLITPTRKKRKSHAEGEEPFEYILIPFESLSRHITAMLQNIDDPDNEQEKDAWELIREVSLEHCETVYDRLNVKITDKHFDYQVVRGESFYRRMLSPLVKRFRNRKIAEESDGAICVFPEGFKRRDGKALPLIIQKSDEAHLYATTDLAALRFRVKRLNAERIIYITDARQKLHFDMLFEVADEAGWARRDSLKHVTFGSILGDDGTPLKTRSGENVKLEELLDKAVKRAKLVVEEKNPALSVEEKAEIAEAVGIGAVKYADYSNNRTSDYVFSFDKMLAMDGNTAPYMQYAYARIKSIERKAQSKDLDIESELAGVTTVSLAEQSEVDLAKHLIRYGEAIQTAAADYRPNYLTVYLYELAQKFSAFYTNCPVLGAGPDQRPTRLLLCDLTARTIKHGLHELLGIEVVEQM
nr:arginine--tRNA ligase [Planctomycetota bacterium]